MLLNEIVSMRLFSRSVMKPPVNKTVKVQPVERTAKADNESDTVKKRASKGLIDTYA